jgi:hypothetical protein
MSATEQTAATVVEIERAATIDKTAIPMEYRESIVIASESLREQIAFVVSTAFVERIACVTDQTASIRVSLKDSIASTTMMTCKLKNNCSSV